MCGEIRVTDPRMPQRYYYTGPLDSHVAVLLAKGWKHNYGNPDYYTTDNVQIAKSTLEALGLELPVWENNHCYRVNIH